VNKCGQFMSAGQYSAQIMADDTSDAYFEILAPRAWTAPAVFNSPHSGRKYPADLMRMTRLSSKALRKSEDCYIDELFLACVDLGAPLLRAHVPRAYVDLNREAYEFDPRMFACELPGFMNTSSPRVAGGLGTIPRLVAEGEEIYRERLSLNDALRRVDTIYRPYHRTLKALLDEVLANTGSVLLLDCHSMPSNATNFISPPNQTTMDIVIGDRYGASCPEEITSFVEDLLRAQGLRVLRNKPYAGGFITQNYGSPLLGRNALQIEINRALYMDETRFEKNRYFEALRKTLADTIQSLLETLVEFANPLRHAAE
jgi:N-formylglutamate amidohydrolase